MDVSPSKMQDNPSNSDNYGPFWAIIEGFKSIFPQNEPSLAHF